jgi:hypothetical protein
LAYTVSPLALRWSLQVMTDATFCALWMSALAAALSAAHRLWPDLFDSGGEAPKPNPVSGMRWLLGASAFGAMATLTRYQGVLLAPILFAIAWRARGVERAADRRGDLPYWATLLPWALVPAWLLVGGAGQFRSHLAQFGQRTAPGSPIATALNYYNYFEEFVLTWPYYMTWGLFAFMLYGLFRTRFETRRLALSGWAAVYLALSLLALQSMFQAFQIRYLLPLLPLACAACGHGMAVWERKCEGRRARFRAPAAAALIYAVAIASFTAYYQSAPFRDLKSAARTLREIELPEGARIFTNESYNAEIGAAKLRFWFGPAEYERIGFRLPKPGDIVVVSSVYGDGIEATPRGFLALCEEIERGVWRVMGATQENYLLPTSLGSFHHSLYPIFPDVMAVPGTHPNPLARHYRYQRQRFLTRIYRVTDRLPETPPPSDRSPRADPPAEATHY